VLLISRVAPVGPAPFDHAGVGRRAPPDTAGRAPHGSAPWRAPVAPRGR
jgi:hypothetical protein